MKYFFVKFKKQLLRLLAAALVFGAAFLILLYFLGYYDFSFLDRYKVLGEIFDDNTTVTQNGASSFFDPSTLFAETEETAGIAPSSPVTENVAGTEEDTPPVDENTVLYESSSVKRVFDTKKLPDKLLTDDRSGAKTVEELLSDGYTESGISYSAAGLSFVPPAVSGDEEVPVEDTVPKVISGEYVPEKTVLGKMTFSFRLPDSYSLRRRKTVRETVTSPSDDGEWYVVSENVREERPAVELYMGYIMIDDGKDISLVASDSTPLCKIDEQVYFPAYARDKYDRPLFYKSTGDGKTAYYYLSANGRNFVTSDYDEVANGRGLYFDYPASYGKTDSAATTNRNGLTGKMAYVLRGIGMLTSYDFTRAYAFSENRAAVTTTKNRGGLYFIDENGKRAFDTWKYYFNEHGRDVYENLMPPLTDGIESIGFYYYEYGLTRVRRQVIDAYNWAYVGRVRTMKDEHILIRTDGSEYELPAGYTLEGYSDGCILLSKDGLYGFMDYTGEWIAQPIYTDATPFICGLATLTTEDGRVGMIDTEGNIVLQFTYDSISQVSDGLIAAYRAENGWTIFKLMEKNA